MRELTTHKINGCNDAIAISAQGEPGSGGACHHYAMEFGNHCQELFFQNGPPAEVGTNGITNECLLAVLIDRLEGFQSGPYECEENQWALDHLRKAMDWLHSRTKARTARGVEGTLQR